MTLPGAGEETLADHLDDYESAPIGLLTMTADSVIENANTTFLEMTGYDRNDLFGRRFDELLTPAGRIYHETHFRPLLRLQGHLRELAIELTCGDGRRLPVLINAVLRERGDGTRLVQISVFDATERRSYERDLLVAKRRMERLQRITGTFGSLLRPEEVARAAFKELVDGVKADHGVAVLVNASASGFTVADVFASAGTPEERWRELDLATVGPIARALTSGQYVFIEGGDGHPEGVPLLTAAGPATRLAILPLASEAEVHGVICLASLSSSTFQPDERLFLTSFTRICAQALERGRLAEATAEAARRAGFLAALSRTLDEDIGVVARAERVVDMLVPEVADFATVEIPAMGSRPTAARHVDPALREPLLELRELTNVAESKPHSMARARATGEAQFLAEIPESMYEDYVDSDIQRTLLRRLAPRSYAGLPLVSRGQVVGSLLLAMSDSQRRFDESDLPFLMDVAGRAATAIDNARLLEHQQTVAQRLQLSFLPESLPTDERFRVQAWYSPSAELMEIGGDWYDAFMLPGDRLGLVVGDVAGHQMDAVMAMGQLRTALRAFALADQRPSAVIQRLSDFALSVRGGLCATAIYGELDLRTRTLTFSCAGHLPPVVVCPSTGPRLIWEGRSPPLGAIPTGDIAEATVELAAGGALFFFTDGLVERRRESIDEGLRGLVAKIAEDFEWRSPTALDDLAASLLAGSEQADDVCMLTVLLEDR